MACNFAVMFFMLCLQRRMAVSGLVPARFLTIVSHFVIAAVLFWAKDDYVKACLPVDYSQHDFDDKDLQLTVGLSITMALFAIELAGFFGGVSTFLPSQGLISTLAHASASIALAFYLFEEWECWTFWYIFGFCSCLPAVTEIIVDMGVLLCNKEL